ncbi:MAG: NYN domain-containing protein [Acidobacteria bacterium]|nr:NYN domain-containing protein [Acidobacteriota bacterium]
MIDTTNYKWLSLRSLARFYLKQHDTLAGIDYFTTLATWDPAKVARHRTFIRAQENEGVVVVYGEFKRKSHRCLTCGAVHPFMEEKQTDVNIAIRLMQAAVQDRYDHAVIVSGDTDLLPAVRAVHTTFPGKQVGVVIPIGRSSEEMKKQADFHHKMKEAYLRASRLADPLALTDGTVLHCPPNWKPKASAGVGP